ncbi:taste receptor type 2 member 4-like [Hyla sarda]|uniref:taste receptor type 2 member 4-like n=1 Tax=Hyla sarda TaxID=327740 RepID=UPI0024C291EF|nr:taste receptor type 2 member 4-like [Hyla sarda]
MFIFIVNIVNWTRDKTLRPGDRLITSISVCNLVEEMIMSIRFLHLIWNSPVLLKVYFALRFMVVSCNVWFSTFLSVYFCLKIVNVKNTIYICLQRNFYKILPWLFISTVVGSVLGGVPLLSKFSEETSLNSTLSSSVGYRPRRSSFIYVEVNKISAVIILQSTALLVFSSSTLAIITSLFKHIKQVQQNLGGFRRPNMEAHVQTLKTVTFFLCIYIMVISFTLTLSLLSFYDMWSYVIYPLFGISKVMAC